MGSLAALLAGLALGWLLTHLSRHRNPTSSGLERLQLLRWIEDSPGGWLVVDPADGVHLINPRAQRLLQVDGHGVTPRHPQDLRQLCQAPELSELIRNARRRGRLQRWQWQLEGQDLEAYALPGEGGWVAVVLHSRRSLEAQLEQQERWVSDVAHELKTPLTALLLVGDSLAGSADSRSAVLVERLQRELRRLQRLVEDLLELSRLENTLPGEKSLRREMDLGALIEQVWAGLRPLAEERGIGLELEVAGGSRIWADGSRLHRALLNLLDNALRFSPDGGTVRVAVQSNREWCLVSVRDEGSGLREEDLERLFERFYRGDCSRARNRGGGSGLGLSIVQQIAITHGGRVQASNHPEGGALIELVLPVGAPAGAPTGR